MNEEEARETAMMMESAKAQLEALNRQQEIIRITMDEHKRARDTVAKLASGSPGDEVLVPIGADSFVHARISENKRAIISVGADVSFERSPEDSQKILDERIDELSRALNRVTERVGQTESAMQQMSEKLQQFYSQAGGQ